MINEEVFDIVNSYIATHENSDPMVRALQHLIAEIPYLKWGVIADVD